MRISNRQASRGGHSLYVGAGVLRNLQIARVAPKCLVRGENTGENAGEDDRKSQQLVKRDAFWDKSLQ